MNVRTPYRKNDRWPQPVVDRSEPTTGIEDLAFGCIECGEPDKRRYYNQDEPCFDCTQKQRQGGGPLVLIDAGGEDSPHPARIADGSAGWNAGLPPIDNGDGTYRPVTNHELGSNRGVREYAKRHGLVPMTAGRYRGLR